MDLKLLNELNRTRGNKQVHLVDTVEGFETDFGAWAGEIRSLSLIEIFGLEIFNINFCIIEIFRDYEMNSTVIQES